MEPIGQWPMVLRRDREVEQDPPLVGLVAEAAVQHARLEAAEKKRLGARIDSARAKVTRAMKAVHAAEQALSVAEAKRNEAIEVDLTPLLVQLNRPADTSTQSAEKS